MAARITFFFFIVSGLALAMCADTEKKGFNDAGILKAVEAKIESKICEYGGYLTKSLEAYNDKRLNNSDIGKMLHYKELKTKVQKVRKEGRSMKKLSMALIPVIFHLGMTSAWMLLTTLLTAKSVAIGIALLVFKIAVSSAKIASYFTAWKHQHHHEYSVVPHHEYLEHHGHDRSLSDLAAHPEYQPSYTPDWIPHEASATVFKTPYHKQTQYSEEFQSETRKSFDKTYG